MKTAKKIYIENIDLFDYLTSLESAISGKSATALIEEHVFNDILKTKHSKYYAQIMVSEGLKKALASVYEFVSDHIADSSSYRNTKELLIFTSRLYADCPPENVNVGTLQKLSILKYMEFLCARVDAWLERNNGEAKKVLESITEVNFCRMLSSQIREMRDLYETDFGMFMPADILSIVLKGWKLFCDLGVTYSLLVEVVLLIGEPEYSNIEKWEFIDILNKITKEWVK